MESPSPSSTTQSPPFRRKRHYDRYFFMRIPIPSGATETVYEKIYTKEYFAGQTTVDIYKVDAIENEDTPSYGTVYNKDEILKGRTIAQTGGAEYHAHLPIPYRYMDYMFQIVSEKMKVMYDYVKQKPAPPEPEQEKDSIKDSIKEQPVSAPAPPLEQKQCLYIFIRITDQKKPKTLATNTDAPPIDIYAAETLIKTLLIQTKILETYSVSTEITRNNVLIVNGKYILFLENAIPKETTEPRQTNLGTFIQDIVAPLNLKEEYPNTKIAYFVERVAADPSKLLWI